MNTVFVIISSLRRNFGKEKSEFERIKTTTGSVLLDWLSYNDEMSIILASRHVLMVTDYGKS